jgi:hypothetical protein
MTNGVVLLVEKLRRCQMPDLGVMVECNNCGRGAAWANLKDGRRALPPGWTYLQNTTAGDVYFCRSECREAWKGSRDWRMPASQVSSVALEYGYTAPEPELMDDIELEEPDGVPELAAPGVRAYRKPNKPRKPPRPSRPRRPSA